MVNFPKTGDQVIDTCILCEETFEETQTVGKWAKCDNPECGFKFKIVVPGGPVIDKSKIEA